MKPDASEIRQRLLELLYDLLPEEEAQELRKQIASDAVLADEFAKMRSAKQMFQLAARVDAEKIKLNPPETIVAATSEGQLSPGGTAQSGAPRSWKAWYISAAIAACLLTMIGVGGYQWDRSHLRSLNERGTQVALAGPPVFLSGIDNNYSIVTSTIHGDAKPAAVDFEMKSATGETLYREQIVTNPIGLGEVKVPASVPVSSAAAISCKAADGQSPSWVTAPTPVSTERFSAFVSTDKQQYRPGETLRFRSVVLGDLSQKPLSAEEVRCELCTAGSSSQSLSQMSRSLTDGIVAGDFLIPENSKSGEFELKITSPSRSFAETRKNFTVTPKQPPTRIRSAETLVDTYSAGDVVVSNIGIDLAKTGRAASAIIRTKAEQEGNTLAEVWRASDPLGNCKTEIRLPETTKPGSVQLTYSCTQNGKTESISKEIAVTAENISLVLYPEGGDLVAGLENRVYFAAKDRLGKPTYVKGRLIDQEGNVVVENAEGTYQGLGSFAFTPVAKRDYYFDVSGQPSKALKVKLKESRVDRRTVVSIGPPNHPANEQGIDATIRSQQPGSVLLQASRKGQVVGQRFLKVAAGSTDSIVPIPASIAGLIRVTSFIWNGEKFTPIAEQLVYRGPRKKVVLQAKTEKVSGSDSTTELSLVAKDETGKPANVQAGVWVVANPPSKEKSPSSLAENFWLTSDWKGPEDLELADLVLSEKPEALANLHLVLNTIGWRRIGDANEHDVPAFDDDRLKQFTKPISENAPALYLDNGEQLRQLRQQEVREYLDVRDAFLRNTRLFALITGLAFLIWAAFRFLFVRNKQIQETEWKQASGSANLADKQIAAEERKSKGGRTWYLAVPTITVAAAILVSLSVMFLQSIKAPIKDAGLAVNKRVEPPAAKSAVQAAPLAREGLPPPGSAKDPNRTEPERTEAKTAPPGDKNLFIAPTPAESQSKIEAGSDDVASPDYKSTPRSSGGYAVKALPKAKARATEPAPMSMDQGIPPTRNRVAKKTESSGPPASAQIAPPAAKVDPSPAKMPNTAAPGRSEQQKQRQEKERSKKESGAGTGSTGGGGGGAGGGGLRKSGKSDPKSEEKDQSLGNRAEARDSKPGKIEKPADPQIEVAPLAPTAEPRNAPRKKDLDEPALKMGSVKEAMFRQYALPVGDRKSALPYLSNETLFWAPGVATNDSGASKLSLPLPQGIAACTIAIDAHSRDGRLGSLRSRLDLESNRAPILESPSQFVQGDRWDPSNPSSSSDEFRKDLEAQSRRLEGRGDLARGQARTNSEAKRSGGFSNPGGRPGQQELADEVDKPQFGLPAYRSVKIEPQGYPISVSRSGVLEQTKTPLTIDLPIGMDPAKAEISLLLLPSGTSELKSAWDNLLSEPVNSLETELLTGALANEILRTMATTNVADPELMHRAKEVTRKASHQLTQLRNAEFFTNQMLVRDPRLSAAFALLASGKSNVARAGQSRNQAAFNVRSFNVMRMSLTDTSQMEVLRDLQTKNQVEQNPTPSDSLFSWALTEVQLVDALGELDRLAKYADVSTDPSIIASTAAALWSSGDSSHATTLLRRLAAMQQQAGFVNGNGVGLSAPNSRSSNIETTALALIAWQPVPAFVDNVRRAANWLSTQRKIDGSFGSPTATGTAGLALARHAASKTGLGVAAAQGGIEVRVNGAVAFRQQWETGEYLPVKVDREHSGWKPTSNLVELETFGPIGVPFVIAISARTQSPPKNADNSLEAKLTLAKSDVRIGEKVQTTLRTQNRGKLSSEMVFAEIGVPAGLTMDGEQLASLAQSGRIDFYFVQPQKIVIGWRKLSANEVKVVELSFLAKFAGRFTGLPTKVYSLGDSSAINFSEPLSINISRP